MVRLIVVTAAVLSACSGPEPIEGSQTSRPAAKETCAEAVLESNLAPLDRELVPFSQTLLGVETTWGDEEAQVVLISGGYLDDVFEAYDDLEPTGEARTVRGAEATLLASSFLGRPLWAATWREAGETPPCDAHAIIAIGLDEGEFERQLEAIR